MWHFVRTSRLTKTKNHIFAQFRSGKDMKRLTVVLVLIAIFITACSAEETPRQPTSTPWGPGLIPVEPPAFAPDYSEATSIMVTHAGAGCCMNFSYSYIIKKDDDKMVWYPAAENWPPDEIIPIDMLREHLFDGLLNALFSNKEYTHAPSLPVYSSVLDTIALYDENDKCILVLELFDNYRHIKIDGWTYLVSPAIDKLPFENALEILKPYVY